MFGGLTTRSLAVRLIGAAVIWIVLALGAGGVLLSNLYSASVERSFDRRLDNQLLGLISGIQIKDDGTLVLERPLADPRYKVPYSGWYWQVHNPAVPAASLRSRSTWDLELKTKGERNRNDATRFTIAGPEGQTLRLAERFVQDGKSGRMYLFTVAADRQEILADIDAFNTSVFWSLAAFGLSLIAGVCIQVRYGLRPLARIRGAISDIRSGKTESLSGHFPDEVQPLVEELNGLLDHTRDLLARARTHVGNLAHAIKTPLTVLTNDANAKSDGLADTVVEQTSIMRRQVDHYLTLARVAGQSDVLGLHTELAPALAALSRTLEKIHADRGISVRVEGGEGLRFRGERQDLDELMGNLMDNASKWAKSEVKVSVSSQPSQKETGLRIVLHIDDNGPGISPANRSKAFDRGTRLDEVKPGSGLGLSIARDIAGLYGGEIALDESPCGGLRVTVTLPGAESDDGS